MFEQALVELEPGQPLVVRPLEGLQDHELHSIYRDRHLAVGYTSVAITDRLTFEVAKIFEDRCGVRTAASQPGVYRAHWDDEVASYIWSPAAPAESHANSFNRSKPFSPLDHVRRLIGSPMEVHGLARVITPEMKDEYLLMIGKFDGYSGTSTTRAHVYSQRVDVITNIIDPLKWEKVAFNPDNMIADDELPTRSTTGAVSGGYLLLPNNKKETPTSVLTVPLREGNDLKVAIRSDGGTGMSNYFHVAAEMGGVSETEKVQIYRQAEVTEPDGSKTFRWKPLQSVRYSPDEDFFRKESEEGYFASKVTDIVRIGTGEKSTIYTLTVDTTRKERWQVAEVSVALQPLRIPEPVSWL